MVSNSTWTEKTSTAAAMWELKTEVSGRILVKRGTKWTVLLLNNSDIDSSIMVQYGGAIVLSATIATMAATFALTF